MELQIEAIHIDKSLKNLINYLNELPEFMYNSKVVAKKISVKPTKSVLKFIRFTNELK